MKRFRCGDVVPGCSEVFEGPSVDDLVEEVEEHARRDHGAALDVGARDEVRARVRES